MVWTSAEDPVLIEKKEPNDLRRGQGSNGPIILLQICRGDGDEPAIKGGDNHAPQKSQDEGAFYENYDDGRRISAQTEETHLAEVGEPRESILQVQGQGENPIDTGHNGEIGQIFEHPLVPFSQYSGGLDEQNNDQDAEANGIPIAGGDIHLLQEIKKSPQVDDIPEVQVKAEVLGKSQSEGPEHGPVRIADPP